MGMGEGEEHEEQRGDASHITRGSMDGAVAEPSCDGKTFCGKPHRNVLVDAVTIDHHLDQPQEQSKNTSFQVPEATQVDPDGLFTALSALAEWTGTLQGDNPARNLLQSAYDGASFLLAQRGSALDGQRQMRKRSTVC